ncbi:NAD(P)H-binding protein [Nonomuraea sp. NPDC049758]|uniref:NAD(P)H-binding protein n=1 Tax=Nonomuraea sp. NPDC049758 TaxID=3154360 RepID=UPI0034129280
MGRRVAAQRSDPDKAPLVGGSSSAAGVRLPAGAEAVEGDPARPETFAGHLDGVTAVFLHPRAIGDGAPGLLARAAERGARRVVALSAMNVDEPLDEQPSRFRGDRNKEAEAAAHAPAFARQNHPADDRSPAQQPQDDPADDRSPAYQPQDHSAAGHASGLGPQG